MAKETLTVLETDKELLNLILTIVTLRFHLTLTYKRKVTIKLRFNHLMP